MIPRERNDRDDHAASNDHMSLQAYPKGVHEKDADAVYDDQQHMKKYTKIKRFCRIPHLFYEVISR
jgi:hypothetical protein